MGIDEQALGGIETSLNSEIKGRGGKLKVLIDARKRIFQFKYLEQPVPGRDIHLSIDAPLQFFVERELAAAVEKYRAAGGAVIVMDSRSGQVLAMASNPGYDPETIWNTPLPVLKNKAISFLYDPGSTFKVVLAASALENRACGRQETFDCHNGVYAVRDRQIIDVHPYARLSFDDIIVHSSNIGAAQVGHAPGRRQILPDHRPLRIRPPHRHPAAGGGERHPQSAAKMERRLAGLPFLRLRDRGDAAADGGRLQCARLGRFFRRGRRSCSDGAAAGAARARVLSAGSSEQLAEIMTAVVSRGTGKKAGIDGLEIAGKTGTAHKIKTGKYAGSYVSSFGGFFPARDPRVTMFVMIDEPEGLYFGGDVAAPVFKSIAEKIMLYLGIFPESAGPKRDPPMKYLDELARQARVPGLARRPARGRQRHRVRFAPRAPRRLLRRGQGLPRGRDRLCRRRRRPRRRRRRLDPPARRGIPAGHLGAGQERPSGAERHGQPLFRRSLPAAWR